MSPAKHRALVHADPDADRRIVVEDPAKGQQHPLLVVADRPRRAGREDQLPAVDIDIGAEETHAVLVHGGLCDGDELVQIVGDRGGILRTEQRIGAVEVDERDRDLAMLGFPDRRQQRLADRHRDTSLEGFVGELGQHPHGRGRVADRCAAQEMTFPRRRADAPGREVGRELGADHDLACARRSLHLDDARRAGASHDQLAMRLTDQEEVEPAAVRANGHAQVDAATGRVELAHRLEALAHADRRACRTGRVLRRIIAGKQQEEGVATELQEAAVLLVGHAQQVGEARGDGVGHLFGTHRPELRELLGELRESGDVRKDEGPVDRVVAHAPVLRQPLEREAGKVGLETRSEGVGCTHLGVRILSRIHRPRLGGEGLWLGRRSPGSWNRRFSEIVSPERPTPFGAGNH